MNRIIPIDATARVRIQRINFNSGYVADLQTPGRDGWRNTGITATADSEPNAQNALAARLRTICLAALINEPNNRRATR